QQYHANCGEQPEQFRLVIAGSIFLQRGEIAPAPLVCIRIIMRNLAHEDVDLLPSLLEANPWLELSNCPKKVGTTVVESVSFRMDRHPQSVSRSHRELEASRGKAYNRARGVA